MSMGTPSRMKIQRPPSIVHGLFSKEVTNNNNIAPHIFILF
jgi:hypothetical protein